MRRLRSGRVRQVAMVKVESNLSLVRIRVDVIQTVRIKSGTSGG